MCAGQGLVDRPVVLTKGTMNSSGAERRILLLPTYWGWVKRGAMAYPQIRRACDVCMGPSDGHRRNEDAKHMLD